MYIYIYIYIYVCVQERRGMSIPRLNPFLGLKTSHASSNFNAWPYLGNRSACSTVLAT